MTRSTTFAPGEGLPGSVWESGQAVWIADVASDASLPRRAVGGVGRAACGGRLPGPQRARRRRRDRGLRRSPVSGARPGTARHARGRRRLARPADRAPPRRGERGRRRAPPPGDARGRDRLRDHDGPQRGVLEFNPAAERTFGYTSEEAVGSGDGDADRPRGAARPPPPRPAPLSRKRRADPPRPPDRDRGDAPRRDPLPGRADDHPDRRPRRRRLHRPPSRHHRPARGRTASCANRGRAWSRPPTRPGAGSSATSTTAPSSS